MKLQMLTSRRGSEDGFSVRPFEKGKVYEVADTLARAFVREGSAVEFDSICRIKYQGNAEAWLDCCDYLCAVLSDDAASEVRVAMTKLFPALSRVDSPVTPQP